MSHHPIRTAVTVEHNRRGTFAQAGILAVVLFVSSFTLATADPGTAAVNLVPSGGKHRGIVLKSQTVDAVVSGDKGKMWADTRVWLRFQNPASKPITVSVELPGPQLAPMPLPSPLDVRVDDVPLALLTTAPKEGGQPPGATAAIGIPARSSVDVRVSFRQDLPEDQGIVTFAYLLSGADQWAGTPESLRVTVEMSSPISSRSLIYIVPPAHRSNGQTLTWDWESEWVKTKTSLGLAFMSPSWFAEFDAARAAADAEGASAAAHISLSRHYRRLASLTALPFAAEKVFRSRYNPAAIAELQSAIAASASTAERSQAHSLLADLYAQEADRAASSDRKYYLQAAAAEIRLALDGSSTEPALTELADKIFSQLSEEAESSGDSAAASSYDQRLEALGPSSPARANHEPSLGSALSQAIDSMERGDIDAARGFLAARYGPEASVLPGAAPPIVSQTALTVTTTPRGRTIATLLGRGENLSKASALAKRTEAALQPLSLAQVVANANTITITLPAPPGSAMLEVQQALASALPDAPELALLKAVLADARGSVGTQTNLVESTWRYTERADLSRSGQYWQELANRLDSAQTNSQQGLSAAQSEQLQRIRRYVWDSDATAWRKFAANSSVDYRFQESDADTNREWRLRAGESREMFVQRSLWNWDTARWSALVLTAALIGMAALVWRHA
jgi:hypothetical protein